MVPRRPKARTTSGKKIHASGLGQPAASGDAVDRDTQDHRADVLGGGGLEQVRAAAGAVADVVAHEVRDDARVARVVLGDARLHLAHEVGADVRGLGVDAAAELGEQRHERGAEAEADDEERRLGRDRSKPPKATKMPHTPSSDRATTRKPETAPPRMATWTAPTRLCCAAAAVRRLALTLMNMPMMPEAIEQAAPTRNAMRGVDAQLDAVDGRCRRHLGPVHDGDDGADDDRADQGQDADGDVLATDEGDRTLVDGGRDVLHRLRALVL